VLAFGAIKNKIWRSSLCHAFAGSNKHCLFPLFLLVKQKKIEKKLLKEPYLDLPHYIFCITKKLVYP
jgi:hypothetical protein